MRRRCSALNTIKWSVHSRRIDPIRRSTWPLGCYYVNDFNVSGRTWQVNIQAETAFRNNTDDIYQIYVRNAQGGMVPIRVPKRSSYKGRRRWCATTPGPLELRRLRADRARRFDRPGREERYSDRRVCGGATGPRKEHFGCRDERGGSAVSPGHDDEFCIHLRTVSSRDRRVSPLSGLMRFASSQRVVPPSWSSPVPNAGPWWGHRPAGCEVCREEPCVDGSSALVDSTCATAPQRRNKGSFENEVA